MTMRLGRLILPDAEEWTPGRDEVRLAGLVSEPGELDYRALLAMGDALAATADNVDEPVIPVTAPDGPGYYRVEGITVEPDAVGLAAGWLKYEARLTPVQPVRRPQVLSALTQTLRANDNGVATAHPQHGVPAAVEAYSWQPVATAVQEVRPTAPGPAGGGVLYRRAAAGTGLTEARYWVPAESWHQGSCHVLRRVDGVDVPVVGRQTLEQPWRASNGLAEVALTPNGRIRLRWWKPDGTGWTEPCQFGVGIAGGFAFTGWVAAEVTSLGAHQVTIRAQGIRPHGSGGVSGRSTLWLTLRRGSRTLSVTIDTDSVPGHRVTPVPAAAVTDAGTYARLTTAPVDSGGLHWLITAADNFGVVTGTGVVTPVDGRLTWSYGIGAYFDGAAGDSGDVDAAMRDWYSVRSEQVQVG